jgi:parallel beta-helix repeat protein
MVVQSQGTGILTYDSSGPVTLSGNTITGNDVGVYLAYDTGTVNTAGNLISGSTYTGITVFDESQSVSNNALSNEPVGIEAVSDSPSLPSIVLVSGNTFSGTMTSPYSTEMANAGTAAIEQVAMTTTTTTTPTTTTTTETQASPTTIISTTVTPTTTTTTETQASPTTIISTTTKTSPTTITSTITSTATSATTHTATAIAPVTTTVTQTKFVTTGTATATIIKTTSYPPPSLIAVFCQQASTTVGVTVGCQVVVTASHLAPTGRVSWSSGSPGKFSGSSCKLVPYISISTCVVKFTPMAAGSHVVITAKYPGDTNNPSSIGAYNLTVLQKTTIITVSCTPKSAVAGSTRTITCRAKVTGYSPTGIVTWSQSGTGTVAFSSKTCALSKGKCSVTMTASAIGSVAIEASYLGDPNNLKGHSTFTLIVS